MFASFSVLALQTLTIDGACTLGRTDLVETIPNQRPGLIIDLENPASCSGQIVEWNLCYYNPRNFNQMLDNYRIGLQVWRFDAQQQNGVRVGINTVTVNIPQQPSSFQCVSIGVLEADSINVTAGDVLGITLFNNELLPVIANVPAHQLRLFQREALPNFELRIQDSTVLPGNVIHVTAELEVGEKHTV